MGFEMTRIDHVNLRIPVDAEEEAESFWCDLLGMTNVPKPPANAARGGRWFAGSGFEVHVSPDQDFVPVSSAHIAFNVTDIAGLVERLRAAGIGYRVTNGSEEAPKSFFASDPFGNRLEFIEV